MSIQRPTMIRWVTITNKRTRTVMLTATMTIAPKFRAIATASTITIRQSDWDFPPTTPGTGRTMDGIPMIRSSVERTIRPFTPAGTRIGAIRDTTSTIHTTITTPTPERSDEAAME